MSDRTWDGTALYAHDTHVAASAVMMVWTSCRSDRCWRVLVGEAALGGPGRANAERGSYLIEGWRASGLRSTRSMALGYRGYPAVMDPDRAPIA